MISLLRILIGAFSLSGVFADTIFMKTRTTGAAGVFVLLP